MLRNVISAVCRTVAWAASKAADIAAAPIHAILMQFFPAAYEPLPDLVDYDEAVNCDLLPFDPFEHAEATAAAREAEANLVLAWAADSVITGAKLPLPDLKPAVSSWLSSLSIEELDRLVQAGKQAIYGHLNFEMEVDGVPKLSSRGSQSKSNAWDPCFSAGGFAAAAQRAA